MKPQEESKKVQKYAKKLFFNSLEKLLNFHDAEVFTLHTRQKVHITQLYIISRVSLHVLRCIFWHFPFSVFIFARCLSDLWCCFACVYLSLKSELIRRGKKIRKCLGNLPQTFFCYFNIFWFTDERMKVKQNQANATQVPG